MRKEVHAVCSSINVRGWEERILDWVSSVNF